MTGQALVLYSCDDRASVSLIPMGLNFPQEWVFVGDKRSLQS